MKVQKEDFYVQFPKDETALRNRFEVMGAGLAMLKMRFLSNPILETAPLDLMKEYVE